MLRRLDTKVLPNNPEKPGGAAWVPQDLKGKWDLWMTGKMALVAAKSNLVTNDILPRMRALWADQAARDAAKPDPKDDQAKKDDKKKKQRLIDTIDAFAAVLQTTPAWQMAF